MSDAGLKPSGAGTLFRICGESDRRRPSSTRPLSGISVGRITSNVEMRLLATRSRRSSSRAPTSSSSNQVPALLTIPFSAITGFHDPKVNFELRFQAQEGPDGPEPHEEAENDGPTAKAADDGSNDAVNHGDGAQNLICA